MRGPAYALIGNKIKHGSEFDVYEYGTSEVLKIPRRQWLMALVFGNFRRKNENDLQFLQTHFADFLPTTRIIDLGESWGILQERVRGRLFFNNPQMTASARSLLCRAATAYQETGRIPDILNPGNVLSEDETDKLFLIDTSVLGGRKWWPIGFLVSRLLGRILFDTVRRWLRSGF